LSKTSGKASQSQPQEVQGHNFWQRLFIRRGISESILLPILAVFTALVLGAFFIAFSDPDTLAAWGNFFQDPLGTLGMTVVTVFTAYSAMITGSIGNPIEIFRQLGIWLTTGNSTLLLNSTSLRGDAWPSARCAR
jgi:ABC-type uncharacterized transport system permease subunit